MAGGIYIFDILFLNFIQWCLEQQIGKANHPIEWSTNFVAHIGQEFRLGLAGNVGFLFCFQEGRLRSFLLGNVPVGSYHTQRDACIVPDNKGKCPDIVH